jgi:hypothetical protein
MTALEHLGIIRRAALEGLTEETAPSVRNSFLEFNRICRESGLLYEGYGLTLPESRSLAEKLKPEFDRWRAVSAARSLVAKAEDKDWQKVSREAAALLNPFNLNLTAIGLDAEEQTRRENRYRDWLSKVDYFPLRMLAAGAIVGLMHNAPSSQDTARLIADLKRACKSMNSTPLDTLKGFHPSDAAKYRPQLIRLGVLK